MKRRLFFGERMLYGDGKTPFNIIAPVKIKGEINEANLHGALRKVQKKHPWLNARVDIDDKGFPWYITNIRENFHIPVKIVERISDEDWQKVSKQEWIIPFDANRVPLIRIVWVKGDEFSEIILVLHHCLCDGSSVFAIIKELLLAIDQPDIELGKETPIQQLSDFIPSEILNNRKIKLKAKLIGKIAEAFLRLAPIKKTPIERKSDYMIHWKSDEETSAQLIGFCKTNGFTVNTFLSLTVLLAFRKVRGANSFNKISLPVDVRNFNPLIKDDHIFAFGLMVVLSTNENPNIIEQAKELQQMMDKKVAKLDPYRLMMMMEACHSSLKRFTNFLKLAKPSNDCMFSNLGRLKVPYRYQNFEVESMFSPSVIGPLGNTTTITTSTFRGQMDFCFLGSEGYLPYEDAKAIQSQINEMIELQVINIQHLSKSA